MERRGRPFGAAESAVQPFQLLYDYILAAKDGGWGWGLGLRGRIRREDMSTNLAHFCACFNRPYIDGVSQLTGFIGVHACCPS